ncbi:20169_t:CDS:2, partial [Racocetra persica]
EGHKGAINALEKANIRIQDLKQRNRELTTQLKSTRYENTILKKIIEKHNRSHVEIQSNLIDQNEYLYKQYHLFEDTISMLIHETQHSYRPNIDYAANQEGVREEISTMVQNLNLFIANTTVRRNNNILLVEPNLSRHNAFYL